MYPRYRHQNRAAAEICVVALIFVRTLSPLLQYKFRTDCVTTRRSHVRAALLLYLYSFLRLASVGVTGYSV